MKRILLTQGQYTSVDDADYQMLSKFKWYAKWDKNRGVYYVIRNVPVSEGKHTTILMHRQITNAPKGVLTDHINHDTLDNRHENLRLVTATQNNQNKRMQKNNTSGYKGVSWNKERRKWSAYIRTNGSIKFLGYFAVLREAAHAYNNAAKSIFGEFACINKLTLTL